MKLFKLKEPVVTDSKNYNFSSPFHQIGDGDLSLPYVDKRYTTHGGIVRFGADNLFPQTLIQMYYKSPLNAAIIDYKTNATVGGGFEFENLAKTEKEKAEVKIDIYRFIKRLKLERELPNITKELIVHERVYFIVKFKQHFAEDGVRIQKLTPLTIKFISSDKVRKSKYEGEYGISEDWSLQSNYRPIKEYHPQCQDEEQLFVYENKSLGQDWYPIPSYSTCLNWCYLDGEMSYLHKTNIKESIFPSFMLGFPKKPENKEEMQGIKDTIERNKGAQNAGRIFTFFANNKDDIPQMQAVPKNNNDQLFLQTDERTDTKICQAHVIDPILMGIRVSGKLGSGSDIKQSYTIFEKNSVMPRRREVEYLFNDLLELFNIKALFSINNYQIINEEIVEKA